MSGLPVPLEDSEDTKPDFPALDWDERKQVQLLELFSRAMSGELGKGVPRKYWETAKLNPRHLQMIMMKAAGYRNNVIAEVLQVSQSNVSVILNQPDSKTILSVLVSHAADEVLDIPARIKAHAGEMLDHVVQVTRNTRNEALRSKNAFELLKMAGYGAVEKKQVETRVVVEKEAAVDLTRALDEALRVEEIDSSGRFTVTAAQQVAMENGAGIPADDEADRPDPTEEVAA